MTSKSTISLDINKPHSSHEHRHQTNNNDNLYESTLRQLVRILKTSPHHGSTSTLEQLEELWNSVDNTTGSTPPLPSRRTAAESTDESPSPPSATTTTTEPPPTAHSHYATATTSLAQNASQRIFDDDGNDYPGDVFARHSSRQRRRLQ